MKSRRFGYSVTLAMGMLAWACPSNASGGLDLEAGVGFADGYHRPAASDALEHHPGIALGLGAAWHWSLWESRTRAFLLGPRLGGLLLTSGSAYPFFIDADVAGALQFGCDSNPSTALVFGAGPSWNNARNVHSFEVEQRLNPAFGIHTYVGYGVVFKQHHGAWLLETRAEARWLHAHTWEMIDTRSGETTSLKEDAGAVGITVYMGYRFGN